MINSVGIIFGCPLPQEVWHPQEMEARCNLGIELYKSGVIQKILLTGKCSYVYISQHDRNEYEVMKEYVLGFGIKEEDIILETNATNTVQNIIFSLEKLNASQYHFISSDYHIIRIISLLYFLGIKDYTVHGVYIRNSKFILTPIFIVFDILYLLVLNLFRPGKIRSIKSNIG